MIIKDRTNFWGVIGIIMPTGALVSNVYGEIFHSCWLFWGMLFVFASISVFGGFLYSIER